MRAPRFLRRLIHDPPPRFIFELSASGIAMARASRPPQLAFRPLDPEVISVSPVKDNVLNMEALAAQVLAVAPQGEKKRQRAVLILPDFSVRISVLDFDAFPADPQEQRSLVRFRIKKSLPFEVDEAGLSYHARQDTANGKKWDVVVAVAPHEILARYEAPFRAAGFQPGVVTTSSVSALGLVRGEGISVLAKLSGPTLTLAVLRGGALKLLRTIELGGGGTAEVASHLFPTFAYIEDQLAAKPSRVLACGFGSGLEDLRQELASEAGLAVEQLRSRFGAPDQTNAGLLGYLESSEGL